MCVCSSDTNLLLAEGKADLKLHHIDSTFSSTFDLSVSAELPEKRKRKHILQTRLKLGLDLIRYSTSNTENLILFLNSVDLYLEVES